MIALVITGITVLLIASTFIVLLYISPSRFSQPWSFLSIFRPAPTVTQFGELVAVFSGRGDHPGQFGDAGAIAVDMQGNIFVSDHASGRINKLDPQGNFLQNIQVPPLPANNEVDITSLAIDASGNLFVAADGNILKYDTSTCILLLTLSPQIPDLYYDDLATGAQEGLYASNGAPGADEVVILSPNGDLMAHWSKLIENVNYSDSRVDLQLAANQNGTVYLISPSSKTVYEYAPDGTFGGSFGGQDDPNDQIDLSNAFLATTRRGNERDYLILSSGYFVGLFDSIGRYLGDSFTIDSLVAGGLIRAMTIDAKGDLYFLSSAGKVLKYNITYP